MFFFLEYFGAKFDSIDEREFLHSSRVSYLIICYMVAPANLAKDDDN